MATKEAVQAGAQTVAAAARMQGKKFEETFKPSRVQPQTAGPAPEERKKRKKGSRILILLLVLILLVVGGAAALWYSGTADVILETFGIPSFLPGAETRGLKRQLEERAQELDLREELLAAREEQLSQREQELIDLQEKLTRREESLKRQQREWEAQVEAAKTMTVTEVLASYSEEQLESLEQVGVIYSKMDPEAAAAVISELYDKQQIAVILYSMTPQAAAGVLEKLDPALAAQVTAILAG